MGNQIEFPTCGRGGMGGQSLLVRESPLLSSILFRLPPPVRGAEEYCMENTEYYEGK